MDSKPDVDWQPAGWRPEDQDSNPTLVEFQVLREQISRVYALLAHQPRPEHPDFNIWFGDHHMVLSANLPNLEPASIRVALVGQTLMLRGSYASLAGQERQPFFERTFTLPYVIDPASLRVNWVMGYLLIQAERYPQDKRQAA